MGEKLESYIFILPELVCEVLFKQVLRIILSSIAVSTLCHSHSILSFYSCCWGSNVTMGRSFSTIFAPEAAMQNSFEFLFIVFHMRHTWCDRRSSVYIPGVGQKLLSTVWFCFWSPCSWCILLREFVRSIWGKVLFFTTPSVFRLTLA